MKLTKFHKRFSIEEDKESKKGEMKSFAGIHPKENKIPSQTFYKFRDHVRNKQQQSCTQKPDLSTIREVSRIRDHIYGNPEAELSIVEYLDFECLYCKDFNPVPKQLVHLFGGSLNWVCRHYPAIYKNPGALIKAEASECANKLGGNDAFWKYAELIFSYHLESGMIIPRNRLIPLAEKIGLSGHRFKHMLTSGRFQFRVLEDLMEGTDIGICQTPSSFIMNNRTGEFILDLGALSLGDLMYDIGVLETN